VSAFRLMSAAALAAALLLPAGARAATTVFTGTYKLVLTIHLKTALTKTQGLYCELDLSGDDSQGDFFKARQTIAAAMKSATLYACTVTVPYNWASHNPNTPNTIAISGSSTAFIYDSTIGAVQLALSSGPVAPIAPNASGGSFTYTTSVDLD
jgi:hypothetical protein